MGYEKIVIKGVDKIEDWYLPGLILKESADKKRKRQKSCGIRSLFEFRSNLIIFYPAMEAVPKYGSRPHICTPFTVVFNSAGVL